MPKARNIINFGAILFLLVGFPLVSFIYLKGGADYRRAAIETMEDFGELPNLYALETVRGTLPDSLRGAMVVTGWLDPAEEERTHVYGMTMDSLYEQFKDSPNLYFTTIIKGDRAAAVADDFAARYNLPDDPMISFQRADAAAFKSTAESINLPTDGPVVSLTNSDLTVVKHYDLAKREETIGLVQLISLIIPLPTRPDIVLDRGKEL